MASGLASRDGKPLTWFEIAAGDGKFVKADGKIDGDTVVVSSEAVPEPAHVRFAWHQEATPNLMNKGGLPASAFRTDGPLADLRKAAATPRCSRHRDRPRQPTRDRPGARNIQTGAAACARPRYARRPHPRRRQARAQRQARPPRVARPPGL